MRAVMLALALLLPALMVYKHIDVQEAILGGWARRKHLEASTARRLWRDRGVLVGSSGFVLSFDLFVTLLFFRDLVPSEIAIAVGGMLACVAIGGLGWMARSILKIYRTLETS